MPSLRITAVAALATAALVVPATASAKDEAATAAVIGNPTALQVNLPAESEWTYCGPEGGSCAFTGTRHVRYGANGKFTLPRTFTDGVACNNSVFGDPVPYVVKQCQVTGGSQTTKDEAASAAAINTTQQQMAEWSQTTQAQTNVQKKADDALAAQLGNLGP